jgi:hypothetical protein
MMEHFDIFLSGIVAGMGLLGLIIAIVKIWED